MEALGTIAASGSSLASFERLIEVANKQFCEILGDDSYVICWRMSRGHMTMSEYVQIRGLKYRFGLELGYED